MMLRKGQGPWCTLVVISSFSNAGLGVSFLYRGVFICRECERLVCAQRPSELLARLRAGINTRNSFACHWRAILLRS